MQPPSALRYRISVALIGVASWFVPRKTRAAWRRQWDAELAHRWQQPLKSDSPGVTPRSVVLWSLGAFSHAIYLLRTEFTMDLIWQDIRYGFRSLRHSPGTVALAVLSLGLGIGANATIFSAVDVFMFRPLPYPDSERILSVTSTNDERGWTDLSMSVPDYLDYRDQSDLLTLAATDGGSFNLSGDGLPERITGQVVTPSFFQVVGISPVIGRGFSADEGAAGNSSVVVISHGLWQRRFGGDSLMVGSTLQLDGRAHTVIGVMPRGFWFDSRDIEIWAPLTFTGNEARNSHFLDVYGRLNAGATISRVTTELEQLARQISDGYPETSRGNGIAVVTLHAELFDGDFRLGATIATVAVAFVLLIACANVANLLLTRAAGRQREVALRGALGAGRSRIVRQFLMEALIVSSLGGILGILLSIGGIRGLVSWMPDWFPRVNEIALDGRVLLFVGIVSGLTGVIFGMAPALQSSKTDLTDTLKEGGRSGSAAGGHRLRRLLVIGEIALALVLLVSSTLLVQGFARIRLADLGFDATDVTSMRITLPETGYPDSATVNQFWTDLHNRLQTLPGVVTVGATTVLPLHGNSSAYYGISAAQLLEERRPVTSYRAVQPNYFATLDIPVLEGREIEPGDIAGGTPVALINQAFADRHWPSGDAMGQHVFFTTGPREIVGVVANTLDRGADDSIEPMVFLAARQGLYRGMSWIVETNTSPDAFGAMARSAVQELDPILPAYNVTPYATDIDQILGSDAIMARIMAVLAGIALVLAIGGVYGVMAYTVSQRTREMGIRLALGAKHRDVLRLVVRQGLVLASAGIGIGLVMGAGVTRSLSTFLFGVSPFDPKTFGGVAAILLAAAVTASYLPARKATRVDPISALRTD